MNPAKTPDKSSVASHSVYDNNSNQQVKNMNWYYCSKCGQIISREAKSERLKSYCDTSNTRAVMTKIKSADQLAIKLRKEYLKNLVNLSEFNQNDTIILKAVFEQAVSIVFNKIKHIK